MRYYHKGERVEESTGQTDRGKAERVLRAKLKDADTERFVPPAIRKITFETLMDRVVREHARRGNRSRLTCQLAHLATTFQGWPVERLDADAIDAYADDRLKAGAAVATVNRELAVKSHELPVADDLDDRVVLHQSRVPTTGS
jgi:hypothetical protein